MVTRPLLLSMLGVALLSSGLTLAGALLAYPPASRAEPDQQLGGPIARVQGIELVDPNGAVRARLGVEPNGAVGLTLVDQSAGERLVVAVGADGKPSIGIAGQQGVAALAETSTGSVTWGISRDGRPRVGAGLTPEGSVNLFVADASGQARVSMGVQSDDRPYMRLSDPAGTGRVQVTLLPDGTPVIAVLDEAGQPIWRAP